MFLRRFLTRIATTIITLFGVAVIVVIVTGAKGWRDR